MRSLINLFAIVLIIFGIISLAYTGFSYKSRERVAQIGNVEVTAETNKNVYFSPAVGGLSLAVGIVLIIIGRMSKS